MREYKIPMKEDGELDFTDVTQRPGEIYKVYAAMGDDGQVEHIARVTSEAEDHEMQEWIMDMIEANVSYEKTPQGRVFPLMELAEFIQRRLLTRDPLYTCHEIEVPEPPYDPETD